MNTSATAMTFDDRPRPARAAPHATHKFKLLLRREFWEHKGGFFWAPIWAGGISLLLTLLGLIAAEMALRKSSSSGFKLNGEVMINGLDLSALTSQMNAGDLEKFANSVSMSAMSAMIWPMLVLGFVVFFYCLGSLFDERQNRSVLFWKSLPVSDRDTVLSKVASALVVAPAMAMAVGIACMIGFLLILSMFVLFHGGNPFTLLWSPSNLLANAGVAIAALPLYALWALPSVGWLLLCSVWARSKPFLWALAIPVFAGVFISWFDLMNAFDLNSGWFWKNVVAHLLGGVFPGTWMHVIDDGLLTRMPPTSHVAVLRAMYSVLGAWQLWVGVVAGIAMIAASIRLRRWRDDN